MNLLAKDFQPTPESIPPPNYTLRPRLPSSLPVHITPLNPLSFLLKAAAIFPEKLAIAHPDVPNPVYYNFAIWSQRVQNFAYALKYKGIQPGDRVAIIAPNCPMIAGQHHARAFEEARSLRLSVDAHQGCLAARAVIAPINIRLTIPEVNYILEHSGAKILLVDHEFRHLARDYKLPVVLSNDTGTADDPYEQFLASGRKYSEEQGWTGLDLESDEDAPASLCYTSGTTGRPKGVISTLRGSYLAAIGNAFETQLSRESAYLWVLPMFHAAGWTFPWACTFAMSLQVTIRSVSFPLIWKHFLRSGVTHYCGAPTVQIGIINAPDARRLSYPVQAIVAGSAPTAFLISELEKLHISVCHVYGLTEVFTYGPFTRSYTRPEYMNLSLEERAKFFARQGHAFVTADEARVVEQSENQSELRDVPADGMTVGEIVTRGNIVMKGYFRDPEATNKAFKGGSFHSGDLAVRHPDGSIAIMDRSKDLIISGGENASSLAIETELATHPDVLEVSVVARPHPKWGERPMAFVLLRPQARSKWKCKDGDFEAELRKFARTKLPGFACPEWVQLVDELPKTSTGKILKTRLRKIAAKL